MGGDAGRGHIEGKADVHERLAVLQDGGDELIHKISVRPATASTGDAGRQRRTFGVGQVF